MAKAAVVRGAGARAEAVKAEGAACPRLSSRRCRRRARYFLMPLPRAIHEAGPTVLMNRPESGCAAPLDGLS